MPDFPPDDDVCGALEEHVRRCFQDNVVEPVAWNGRPIADTNPHFHVLRVAPTQESGFWTYVSIGGWSIAAHERPPLEFIVATPLQTERAVELLAMTVFYNRYGRLGMGDTSPIGEPWLPGSQCDYFLLSEPYPYVPELGTAHVGDRHIGFAWLLPITESERDFKIRNGLEALESLFEDAGLQFADVTRRSVVS